jgi:hypothetical protein
MRAPHALAAAVASAALALSACSPDPAGTPPVEVPPRESAPSPEARTQQEPWPEPSASRPVVDLRFTVADDLASVTGTERVELTPDLEVCELVFRAWANKPNSAAYGSAMEVTAVTVEGERARPEVIPAGAPEGVPGTLIEVPLPECVDAGTTVTADLDFVVTLGRAADERVGVSRDGDVAWFAGAFPLLAWEDGRGWARDPAVAVLGEMSTSESFRLRSLEVVAPARYQVLGTGRAGPTEPGEGDVVTHRFEASAVRDVAVTVGSLDVVSRDVDGVRLHVGGAAAGTRAPLETWADQLAESLRDVGDLLGPVPYADLWVSVLPSLTDGIEVSGAIQFGDLYPIDQAWLVTHEVAHMWFHGLVGNNQARDPWLDEAFATAVQRIIADDGPTRRVPPGAGGRVGAPMEYWADRQRPGYSYVGGVYLAGGAALLEARERVGPDAFDPALRGYLADNAHRIAVPADVERAFGDLPEVLEVLREAGALTSEP